ncbi:hypothetical protein O181_039855 [Austropuccinia psidii MF-1]|uniref:Uncharacterized protein n=1 Tax=Austropuccinia psidii MF-1 TaxID=1389203 RepID=A0A9Q3HFK0_9BASI|nr:hypothetical protein [Austropuccinia psidii MF-1]
MEDLGNLGPLWPLQPTDHRWWDQLGPFWPTSNEAKGGRPVDSIPGGSQATSWPTGAYFWPKTQETQNAQKYQGPKTPKSAISDQGPKIPTMPSGKHQRPPATFNKGVSSQVQQNPFPTSMDPSLQEPSVMHIRYYIPLCTIFPQQSNSDVFRTQFCNYKSSPQIHH